MNRFMEDHYTGFKGALEWTLYTVSDDLVPVARAPFQAGDARPRAGCPCIEGLSHPSDSAECSLGGNDAAIHSGIIEASQISGGDYVEKILPDYARD
jgi:hypothetical protein